MTTFIRAAAAFVACPGMVAGAVPVFIVWRSSELVLTHPAGLVVLALGLAGLAWCVRDFYAAGAGTLAPWDPPRHLVTVGLYRFSRNPMYVAVATMLLGWALAFASPVLLGYALLVMLAFRLRVAWGEEPWLRRAHGPQWDDYTRRVRRWL
jgi:protein-S-isoprenylcysteine O-methyltransferase Ste14